MHSLKPLSFVRLALPIFLVVFPVAALSDDKLRPFTSDGCSAFPDGTSEQNQLWLDCCTAHDLAYWKGGTYDERREADRKLQACVAAVGEPEIAQLMLAGVRVGGSPFFPTGFRWGYGWPYPRFYRALTEEELVQVQLRFAEREKEEAHGKLPRKQ